jgi:hypothetical protein
VDDEEDVVDESETTQEQVGAAAKSGAPEVSVASKAKPLAGEGMGTQTSRFTGLVWLRKQKIWNARINIDGKTSNLGYFDDEEDAARKYDEAAASIPGRKLNFPRAAPMQPCINGDVGDDEGEREVLTQLDSSQDAVKTTKENSEETQALPKDLEETQTLPEPAAKASIETSDSSSDENDEEQPAKLGASDEEEKEKKRKEDDDGNDDDDDDDDDDDEDDVEEEAEEEDDFSNAARIETALQVALKSNNVEGLKVALAKASSFEMSLLVLKTTGLALTVGKLRRHSDTNLSKFAAELVSKWKTLRL